MLFKESKWYSLFGPFETSGTLHERTPYALVWEVSNERTEGRRRITYDRKRGRGGRTGRLEVISYPNKPGRWRGARNESGQPTPAHCSPKRFPGSYPRRSPFPRSPPRRNDAGHPCRGFPPLSLRYRLLSSPPYRSKPGVDKCVDHRICVPAAFYEEKPR